MRLSIEGKINKKRGSRCLSTNQQFFKQEAWVQGLLPIEPDRAVDISGKQAYTTYALRMK